MLEAYIEKGLKDLNKKIELSNDNLKKLEKKRDSSLKEMSGLKKKIKANDSDCTN